MAKKKRGNKARKAAKRAGERAAKRAGEKAAKRAGEKAAGGAEEKAAGKAGVKTARQMPAPRASKVNFRTALVANLLILAALVCAMALRDASADLYYASVQEDEALEWATVWAFLIAAGVGLVAAWRQRRATGQLPWFLIGVSLFCVVVAGEEISWGQRIFGYRPPVYFLEHNFQQELNVHNVISTDLRKLAVKGVLLGYGVLLPLLALAPAVRKQLEGAAILAPTAALAPGFFITFSTYESYPWSFTGEWVEVMMGFGFLFAAIVCAWKLRPASSDTPARSQLHLLATIVGAWLLAIGLGAANAAISRHQRAVSPEILETAHLELEALKRDFQSGEARTRCDRHKRIYSFVEKYEQDYLLEGEFAALTAQGLPEERAEFFLDPWNYPYWIRDRCKDDDSDARIVFVYSFGPNRRRESTRWKILGDDIGAIVLAKGLDDD